MNYTYDKNNNRTQMTDGRSGTTVTTTYTYEARNRLTQITEPEARYTAYTYDADGNMRTLRNADANTVTYYWGLHHRLPQIWDPYAAGLVLMDQDTAGRTKKSSMKQ